MTSHYLSEGPDFSKELFGLVIAKNIDDRCRRRLVAIYGMIEPHVLKSTGRIQQKGLIAKRLEHDRYSTLPCVSYGILIKACDLADSLS